MVEEKFNFSAGLKKAIAIVGIVGVVLLIIGIFTVQNAAHHEPEHAPKEVVVHGSAETEPVRHEAAAETEHKAEGEHAEATGHEGPTWKTRLFADLWINNVFFTGIAIIGVFFFALQYIASAGWSAGILRIPMALGSWLPIAFILMIVSFFLVEHDIFHWTHASLYDINSPDYDAIIDGKKAFLNVPFFLGRMVAFFVGWYLLFRMLRKNALAEDIHGGSSFWKSNRTYGAFFVIFFAVSSSIAAWDWVMSIDTHWFSTMFGWYVFASWFVTGLAAITLIVVLLKENGYLSVVNFNHIHDLGKFCFAFSIFWTYIWFSQFLLIYYANIPEETIYFVERMHSAQYAPFFYLNLVLNFFFPFLFLMTRDSKRHLIFLKIACPVIIVGHWFDFFLMVTPGTVKGLGGFGFMEIGMTLIFGAAFLFVTLLALAKHPLVAKNHPMLEESLHHHI